MAAFNGVYEVGWRSKCQVYQRGTFGLEISSGTVEGQA
jgi:hypothetical protein